MRTFVIIIILSTENDWILKFDIIMKHASEYTLLTAQIIKVPTSVTKGDSFLANGATYIKLILI